MDLFALQEKTLGENRGKQDELQAHEDGGKQDQKII